MHIDILKYCCFSNNISHILICSFIGRLFRHALDKSRPKSVLINSLSVCISLLDPKRLTLGMYHIYGRQITHGPTFTANPEAVVSMLDSLGKFSPFHDVLWFINSYHHAPSLLSKN